VLLRERKKTTGKPVERKIRLRNNGVVVLLRERKKTTGQPVERKRRLRST
jgi:hypothetical protein